MSKNLTRKGLVFGAVVALTSTAISGTPAFAANELNLQPSTGTTYGTIIGETFTLSTNTNPGFASSEFAGTKLKFNVTNAGKAALTITAGGAANAGSVNAGAADNSNYVVTHQAPSSVAANTIAIATAATATSSVGVQAWVDSDFDSVVDANEWSSSIQTIVFNKASEVTWTTEFTTPVIGDSKFTAYLSASPSINVSQVANANLGVRFGKNATDAGEQFVGKASATLESNGKLKFNPTIALAVNSAVASPVAIANNAAAVAGGFRYDAQAAYLAAGLGTGTGLVAEANLVGSQVAYSVAAATIGRINAPATTASNDLLVATAPAFGTTDGVTTVRSTATTVPVSILVQDATPAALKDTKVTVYVAEKVAGGTDGASAVGNADASTFTAGGKTLKDTSSSVEVISFEATSDAEGKVNFNLTSSAVNGDGVAIWASAQGVNVNGAAAGAVSTAAEQTVYNWTTAAPASVVNSDLKGTSAVLKQAAGSTFALNFTVIDQFGAAIPTADKYRVAVSDGSFGANDANQYAVVSGGKASVSFTLASTATGTKTYTYKAQTKAADGNYGTDLAGSTVSVVVGTSNAASSFTALSDITTAGTVTAALSSTATNTLALSTRTSKLDTTAFVAGDKNQGATNSVKGTLTTGFVLAGAVTDATTAGTYSTVTFSGANLNFVVGTTLYAAGSVTIQTDASGNYAGVRVLSNKSGEQTLTITAGSVSKSYVVDFGAPAEAAGTTLSITAPATIKSGRTLTVVAKLVDKFGNPVAVANTAAGTPTVTLAYDGPGFTTSTITQTLDAKGSSTFRVLLGAADAGAANVTFTYDADGTTATEAKITKTSTILVGVSATVAAAKKAASATVKNAAGLTVKVVSGTKSVTKVATSDSYKVSLTKLTAGKKTVKVYVEGILVLSKSVTVKK